MVCRGGLYREGDLRIGVDFVFAAGRVCRRRMWLWEASVQEASDGAG